MSSNSSTNAHNNRDGSARVTHSNAQTWFRNGSSLLLIPPFLRFNLASLLFSPHAPCILPSPLFLSFSMCLLPLSYFIFLASFAGIKQPPPPHPLPYLPPSPPPPPLSCPSVSIRALYLLCSSPSRITTQVFLLPLLNNTGHSHPTASHTTRIAIRTVLPLLLQLLIF
jgi:hypothetical protein